MKDNMVFMFMMNYSYLKGPTPLWLLFVFLLVNACHFLKSI